MSTKHICFRRKKPKSRRTHQSHENYHSEHVYWEQARDKWVQVGDKPEIVQPKKSRTQWETTGKQVRNHADQSTQSIQSVVGDKWETSAKPCGPKHLEQTSLETKAKSCGPSMHPFQRTTNEKNH